MLWIIYEDRNVLWKWWGVTWKHFCINCTETNIVTTFLSFTSLLVLKVIKLTASNSSINSLSPGKFEWNFRHEWHWTSLMIWCGWGWEVSCGGHHQQRGKTRMGSALGGAVLDFTQILAYLVTQYEQIPIIFGVWPFRLTPFFFSVNNILAGSWLNCISSEITLSCGWHIIAT